MSTLLISKFLCYNIKEVNIMKKEPTQTMTIRVPMSLHLQLQMAAYKDSRTVNSLVNKILSEYVEGQKKWGTEINLYLIFNYIIRVLRQTTECNQPTVFYVMVYDPHICDYRWLLKAPFFEKPQCHYWTFDKAFHYHQKITNLSIYVWYNLQFVKSCYFGRRN